MEHESSSDLVAIQGNRKDRCDPESTSVVAGSSKEGGGRGVEIPEKTVLEGKAWTDHRGTSAYLSSSWRAAADLSDGLLEGLRRDTKVGFWDSGGWWV